ncbi:hypothetical protein Ahu01nite_002400 [Winogradskya humida]|uniref:Type II toxin-antitoxin system RelE/ParE family toxin n=1 Tax=Winogradskya humida TaxID=113566 RepID=A0ABQ3ZF48_9ACTN|nr:hypothetical protein Ahu01nite_002400 [Actinoplanes humidus]
MGKTSYTDEATDDLRELVSDPVLIGTLLKIGCTELRAVPQDNDEDEGRGKLGLLWRRGITRDQRRDLDPLSEPGGTHSWDFLLIYRNVRRDRFLVLRVLPTHDVLGTVDLRGLLS